MKENRRMAGQSMVAGVPFHGQIPNPTNKVAGYGNDTMMHRVGKVAEYSGAAYGTFTALRNAWQTLRPIAQGLRGAAALL